MKTMLFISLVLALSGCASYKKNLIAVNQLLIQAKEVDCTEVNEYIGQAQTLVEAEINK